MSQLGSDSGGWGTWRRIHLVTAFVFLGIFALTGLYMSHTFPHAHRGDPGERASFHATHIYILLSGLLNGMPGLYLNRAEGPLGVRLQVAGSVCLLVVPALFTIGFFLVPSSGRAELPFVMAGLILAILGALLHLIGHRVRRQA